MSVENNVYTDLKTSIRRAWPDVATSANGIYETDMIDKIPWETLTPPYAVIAIEEFPESGEGSQDTTNYLPEAHIYYVAATTGPLTTMRDKLSALKDDLLSNVFANIEVWQIPLLSYSRTIDANLIFAQKRMPHQAGRVCVKCFVGTGY